MTMTEPAADAVTSTDSLARRAWSAPMWAHLLVLLIGLLGVVLLTSPPGTLVADDGSYQLQLRALDQGSWNWTTGTESLDPDGTHYPITGTDRTDDGWAPFAKHPAWPWLAHVVSPLTGVSHAFTVLGVLGVLGLAAAAWLLAGEREVRWSRWAFWLAGTAPVAITAAVPWAHSLATATAGFAVLAAVRLVRRPSGGLVLLLAGSVVGVTLLRTEGLLLAGALGVALVVGGRQERRSWPWALGAGGTVVALSLAVVKVEEMWISSITRGTTSTFKPRDGLMHSSSFLDARTQGAVRSLIDSAWPSTTTLLGITVVAAAITAWLAASGRPGMVPRWQIASALSVSVLVLRGLSLSNYPVSGLLATWPVAVAGLAAAAPVVWRRARMETVVAGSYIAAILATQYADGGGGSWGGRFFALGTVPLAVLTCVGIERLLLAQPHPAGLVTVRRFLVTLVIVPTVVGLAMVHSVESGNASLYQWVEDNVEGVVLTREDELPRMMWQQDVDWLTVEPADHDVDLRRLVRSLEEQGEETISLVALDADVAATNALIEDQGSWREVHRATRENLTVVVLER